MKDDGERKRKGKGKRGCLVFLPYFPILTNLFFSLFPFFPFSLFFLLFLGASVVNSFSESFSQQA
jgi:hypothetical protein